MSKFYQFIFDYLQKQQPKREPRFPHWDQPLKILILYESDPLERNDAIKSIRQDLLRQRMDISMWGYLNRKEIQTLILPQSRILGTEDYNFLGKPKDQVILDLQTDHYDLMIDLTTQPCLPLRYIAMYANADCKVGLNLGEGIHDILISLPNLAPEEGEQLKVEATWLYNQIMKYITVIKSND